MIIRLLNYYNREIESKVANKLLLFIGILVINFLVIGWFGILPGLAGISEKNRVRREFLEVKQGISSNIKQAEYFTSMMTGSEQVEALNTAITTQPLVHKYMEDLVTNMGDVGFELISLSNFTSDAGGNTVELDLKLIGPVENLAIAVKGIEDSSRLTRIKTLIVVIDDSGRANVMLGLEIYFVD
jgi:hypothetical protein